MIITNSAKSVSGAMQRFSHCALLWTIFLLMLRYVSNTSRSTKKFYSFKDQISVNRSNRGLALWGNKNVNSLALRLNNMTTGDDVYERVTSDPVSSFMNSSVTPPIRTHVVNEEPTLDVGPLDMMSVEVQSSTMLKCAHKSLILGDTVRLILWYKNDTRRPFFSFDARKEAAKNSKTDHRFAVYDDEDDFGNSSEFSELTKLSSAFFTQMEKVSPRITLGKDGVSLLLRNVEFTDQAEYRCKVHYKTSPSFTYRLQLIVVDAINDIHILNASNVSIASEIGPYKDGEKHTLYCIAKSGCKFSSLDWILNGQTLPSTLQRQDETAVLMVDLHLCQSYAYSMLHCRLSCENPKGKGRLIRERATKIIMFYVPRATLLINANASGGIQTWPEAGKGGAKVEISEGQNVVFLCIVRAKPPPYNITWLRNGQRIVLSKQRIMIENSSLTIREVRRKDDGLYTCLASNSEGDGPSNAVLLRIRYSPRCSVHGDFSLIVARNISISLECNFDAEPDNVTFTWHRMKIEKGNSSSKVFRNNMNGHGGVITGDLPSSSPFPKLIDLTPERVVDRPSDEDEDEKLNPIVPEGPSLVFQRDPKDPTRSFLRIRPSEDPEGYVCFAKNSVGHSKVPCVFRLDVIDPPNPPQGCKVEDSGISTLKVTCLITAHRESILGSHQSPDISLVRALETRTSTVLEVWALGTLVANLSSEKGSWNVVGLTPDTDLRLRIYATSLHAHSIPVVLYARTRNLYQTTSTAMTETNGFVEELDSDVWVSDENQRIWIIVGVGLGIFSLIVLCILGWFYMIRIIRKRKSRHTERNKKDKKVPGFNDNWSDPSSSSQPATIPSPNIQMMENPSSQMERSVS